MISTFAFLQIKIEIEHEENKYQNRLDFFFLKIKCLSSKKVVNRTQEVIIHFLFVLIHLIFFFY